MDVNDDDLNEASDLEPVKDAKRSALSAREKTMVEAQNLVGSYSREAMLNTSVIHIYPSSFVAPEDGSAHMISDAERTSNYQLGGIRQFAYYPKPKGYMIAGSSDLIFKKATPTASYFGKANAWTKEQAQEYNRKVEEARKASESNN